MQVSFLLWTLKQEIPPNILVKSTGLHGVTYQKTRTSNLAFHCRVDRVGVGVEGKYYETTHLKGWGNTKFPPQGSHAVSVHPSGKYTIKRRKNAAKWRGKSSGSGFPQGPPMGTFLSSSNLVHMDLLYLFRTAFNFVLNLSPETRQAALATRLGDGWPENGSSTPGRGKRYLCNHISILTPRPNHSPKQKALGDAAAEIKRQESEDGQKTSI